MDARAAYILASMVLVYAPLGWATTNDAQPPPSTPSAPTAAPVDHQRELLQSATAAFLNRDFIGAAATLKGVVRDPAFSQLTIGEQHSAQMMLGFSAAAFSDFRTALESYRAASEMPPSGMVDWHYRLDAAYRVKDYDDAAASMITIARRWPKNVPGIEDDVVYRTVNGTNDRPSDQRIALFQALFDAEWRPSDVFKVPDEYWYQLALLYLEQSRLHEAELVAARITAPYNVLRIVIDRRFDPITASDPRRWNYIRSLRNELALGRKLMAAHPRRLRAVNWVAADLLWFLDAKGAASLLDQAIAKALPSAGEPGFSDVDAEIMWTMDLRGQTAMDLGHVDEALALYERGARRPENGVMNISQTINLGLKLYREGRPNDALEAVTDLREEQARISGYGAMLLNEVRACSYAQLHDDAAVARAVQYVRTHAKDAPSVWPAIQLCTNDLDGLAATLIAQLGDQKTRADTLTEFQHFIPERHRGAFEAELGRRWDSVAARLDVNAAVDAVGHVMTFDREAQRH